MTPGAFSDARSRLDAVVKAYDVRGIVGEGLTAETVEALGAAFVDEVGATGGRLIVGHDMRDSSPGFAEAFSRGATRRGADVVAIVKSNSSMRVRIGSRCGPVTADRMPRP